MAGWRVTFTVIRDGYPPMGMAFSKSPITIGSSSSADVVLSDPHVSSRHASVLFSQGQLVFQDMSSNGSYREGVRIKEARLGQAGIVSIPPYSIHVCLDLTEGDGTILRSGDARVPPIAPAAVNAQKSPVNPLPPVVAPAPSLDDTAHTKAASMTVTQGPAVLEGREFCLVGRKRFSLGRSPECEIALDVPSVSRRHAALSEVDAGGWEILDLESSNGVIVNGKLVKSARLVDGDVISIGGIVFRFAGPPVATNPGIAPSKGEPQDTRPERNAVDEDPSVAETLRIRRDRASANPRVIVLRVAGRVDGYSYHQLRDALSAAAESGDGLIGVDLSACHYCDHTGMGALLSTQTALVRRGGQLRLFGANAKFRDALLLLRLESILKLSADEETAVEELQSTSTGRRASRNPGSTKP